MDRLLSRLLVLVWGAWFGGLLGVFLAVTTVFAALDPDRTTAGVLGAAIFHRTERLILIAAAITLVTTLGLILRHRQTSRSAVFVLLSVATLLALGNTLIVTPRIDRLRDANLTASDDFKRTHGISMGLYSSQTLVLALAGLLLPAATTTRQPSAA